MAASPGAVLSASGRSERERVLIGSSSSMQELARKIEVAAGTRLPVLIEGETGTGKELVAQEIHHGSARASKPLVIVDCSTIPENLLESELFGHGRGAFTGAVGSYEGRIAEADGGTLFFDEIGSVSLSVQAKLLRFLETGEFPRVREPGLRRVDVRVLTATSQFLEEGVEAGRVRKDFYYRLSALHICVAPLRQRKQDIPLLADRFIREAGASAGLALLGERAQQQLQAHDWPGNVRELKNALLTALAQSGGGPVEEIDLCGLGGRRRSVSATPRTLRGHLRVKEREFLTELLLEKGASLTEMADAADVSIRTLQRKLRFHKLRL